MQGTENIEQILLRAHFVITQQVTRDLVILQFMIISILFYQGTQCIIHKIYKTIKYTCT